MTSSESSSDEEIIGTDRFLSLPCVYARTATDIDGTFHTDLWKSETSREKKTLISLRCKKIIFENYFFTR